MAKWTFKKIINLGLVKLSLAMKMPKVMGQPTTLFIEPTNICNLKCPLCPTGNGSLKKKKGIMDFENYKKLIDETGDRIISITLWNYGEPFINPRIIDMIKYAKKKGVNVVTSTNGYGFADKKIIKGIVESGVDRLIVALDGTDQKTLSKYRVNADFESIVSGIKQIADLKRKHNSKYPHIELQFIIMKQNEKQIQAIERIAKETGANELVLKTVNIYGQEKLGNQFLPESGEYRRYDPSLNLKQQIKNNCDGLWFGLNINWDGNVIPCCYDPHETLLVGNAFKENIKKIWNNQKLVALRKAVLKDKKSIPTCAKCPTNVKCNDYKRIIFKKIKRN